MAHFEIKYRLAEGMSATVRLEANSFEEAMRVASAGCWVSGARMIDAAAEITVQCPRCRHTAARHIEWGSESETIIRCGSCDSQLRLSRERAFAPNPSTTDADRAVVVPQGGSQRQPTLTNTRLLRWKLFSAASAIVALIAVAAALVHPGQERVETHLQPPNPGTQGLDKAASQNPAPPPKPAEPKRAFDPVLGREPIVLAPQPVEDKRAAKVRMRLERAGEPVDAASVAAAVRTLRDAVVEPEPATGVIRRGYGDVGVAPLGINTDGQHSYYIKVLDSTSKRELLTAFIRRGDYRFETTMPLGSCEIRYVAGDHWFGETLDFGLGFAGVAAYSKCDDRFVFSVTSETDRDVYHGNELTLILLPDGNLKTEPIDATDF